MPAAIGPIIFDLADTHLTSEDKEILQHPLIGGVIFFTRNYESIQQLTSLCKEIRALRKAPILLTVDQEGGRVQRFHEGFTRLPSMAEIGEKFEGSAAEGLAFATQSGKLMATELLAVGMDLSFAPVLDLDLGISQVIGDRAFHSQPENVFALANAFANGMREAGMAAVGKHFPGHGSVATDTHVDVAIDERQLETIFATDILPFQKMIDNGLEAVLAAHVLFPQVDNMPAGFSPFWLQKVLRKKLKFDGMIFSDALDMLGASAVGDFPERVEAALSAGCDMALLCNQRDAVIKTIDNLSHTKYHVNNERFYKCKAQNQKRG